MALLAYEKGDDTDDRHQAARAYSQAIEHVKLVDLPDTLLMELLRIGGFMEVKITSENLIGTFPTEDHLNAYHNTCHENPG